MNLQRIYLVLTISCFGGSSAQKFHTIPDIATNLWYSDHNHGNLSANSEIFQNWNEIRSSDLLSHLQSVLTKQDLTGPYPGPSAVCINHTAYILERLTHEDNWAISFADALGKLPSGVLEGAFSWIGSYTQCLNISANMPIGNDTSSDFVGRYCLVSVGNTQGSPIVLSLGVCAPDPCHEYDVGYLVAEGMNMLHLYGPWIIKGVMCKASEPEKAAEKLDSQAIGVISMLSALGALITLATFYDFFLNQSEIVNGIPADDAPSDQSAPNMNASLGITEYTPLIGNQESPQILKQTKKSLGVRLLLCFSLLTNGCKLLSTRQTSQRNLGAVHGIRFISMSWVILGHTFAFVQGFYNNQAASIAYMERYSFMAIIGASVSVDTFFLLSGVLAGYVLLNKIKDAGGVLQVNWALVYFHRFWRLTPPYMLVIAVYTTLYHYMGDGVFYPEVADANCQKAWWQNLLYINNFFTSTKACIDWTWYLANDMQFFVITPFIVIALYKWVAVGFIMIFALLLVNMIVVGILTAQNGYPADFANLRDMDLATNPLLFQEYFDQVYVRPYCRVGPYAVGLAVGYVLMKTELKPNLNKLVVLVGWLVAVVCCYEVVYGLYPEASGQGTLTPAVSAFYASVHRIVWAVGVSWVILACCTGYGGPVNTFLSWSAMVPLSRLTYMAYLVHPAVIFYIYQSLNQMLLINDVIIILLFVGNMVLSYAVAFVVCLAFESPMMALEKVVFPSKT